MGINSTSGIEGDLNVGSKALGTERIHFEIIDNQIREQAILKSICDVPEST